MKFIETKLPGAFVIEPEKKEDKRGFFTRTWCKNELGNHGLKAEIAQVNINFNKQRGTLRGMHYQAAPYGECKIIKCTRGAVFDVVIDLRKDSPTYLDWIGVELTGDNFRMLYVPENFSHGFITLEDQTEICYMVTQFYTPEAERGIRWDDPSFNIKWPLHPQVISDKDSSYPDFKHNSH